MTPELPVPQNLRALSLHRLQNCQSRRCRLDDAQKQIFAVLDGSPDGLTMDQLRGKRPKSYEGYLLTSLSEMRDKLDDFFSFEGCDLVAICSIPELRKGRKARGELGRYSVKWQMRLTGSTSVPRVVRSEDNNQIVVPGHRLLSSEESRAMDLAIMKMRADFSYSALNNLGDLQQCIRTAYQSAEFFTNESHVREIADRIVKMHLRLNIPDITNPPERPNPYVATLCRELVAGSDQEPVKVNCEAIEIAALATFRSMKQKYGVQMYVSTADRSGKEVVITIDSDDGADFAVVPNAPLLLVGQGCAAPSYRLLIPIHAEDQVLLRKGNKVDRKLPTVLVYAESSAAEQWYNLLRNRVPQSLWRRGHPWGDDIVDQFRKLKEPIWVDRLEDLLAMSLELREGDYVIAWHPLFEGLMRSTPSLKQVGEPFQHWLSLCVNKRWCAGEAPNPRCVDFLRMFIYEWRNCRHSPNWAETCLQEEGLDFLDYFKGGAGLSEPSSYLAGIPKGSGPQRKSV